MSIIQICPKGTTHEKTSCGKDAIFKWYKRSHCGRWMGWDYITHTWFVSFSQRQLDVWEHNGGLDGAPFNFKVLKIKLN